jgi:hypothetical protein
LTTAPPHPSIFCASLGRRQGIQRMEKIGITAVNSTLFSSNEIAAPIGCVQQKRYAVYAYLTICSLMSFSTQEIFFGQPHDSRNY